MAGRTSVFSGKEGGVRVQGILTKRGGAAFEEHRRDLLEIVRTFTGRPAPTISDADVIEFLARGKKETIAYLRER